jgi:hypothetical protein
MSPDPTGRERQARFAERIREQGLVKICEWIPAECRDTFKAIARNMRDGVPVAPPPAAPPPQPDETADRVRQAYRWGWAPNAIAAYLGISADQVERILKDNEP